MSRPTIVVVIAVLDGEAFVAAAVRSALDQTRAPHEIIVVDDGSSDRTGEIVRGLCERHPTVHLLSQANAGAAAARNRGIEASTCDLVAPLDADDRWPPDRLEVMAAHLDAHPEVAVVLGQQQVVVETEGPLPDWVTEAVGDDGAFGPLPVAANSFLARRLVFDDIGGYAEDMRHGEDTDWVMRVRDRGHEVAILPDVVLLRRVHDRNLTHDDAAQRRAMFDVLRRRMVRRRAGAMREEEGCA